MATVAERVVIGGLSAGAVAGAGDRDGVRASGRDAVGRKTLNFAVQLWFLVALVGQLIFVLHIVSFYGRSAAVGDFAHWNKALSVGYIAGDPVGNSALGAHLLAAATITLGGLLQLMPQIRGRWPKFHRWTGRTYVVMALLGAASALYLQGVRVKVPGGPIQHSALAINAVLIMIFAVVAAWYARARQFETHRRWALRLFLVVSGSWFFRVGLFAWILINHGPVGFDPDKFEGPALTILSFAQYLLPLAVLELYLRAQPSTVPAARKFIVAGVLVVFTIVVAIGIFGHTMFMVSSGLAV